MFNRLFLRFKNSIWVVPGFFSIGASLLAVAVILVDRHLLDHSNEFLPYMLIVDTRLAQLILSTIAGCLLTMTTITFSTIMVVLTTYSSQFSPRTLQNFMHNPVSMRVLGIFIGGFVYSITSLLFMNKDSVGNHAIAATVGILLAFICASFFAYFIHHVATSIQVSELIKKLANDVLETIEETVEEMEGSEHISLIDEPPVVKENYSKMKSVHTNKFGYIQLMNTGELSNIARENRCYIEITKPIGGFLAKGKEYMKIYHFETIESSFEDEVTIGSDRTTIQDVGFGLRKLTEVSLRAISPGTNDPNTAIECIRHLGMCLKAVSRLSGSYIVYYDKDKRPLLTIPQSSFEELLHSSFYQILHYGSSDISIIGAILDTLLDLAQETSSSVRNKTIRFSSYVFEKADTNSFTDYEKEVLKTKKERLTDLL